MSIRSRVEDVLEHFDYCLVKVGGHDSDNIIAIQFPTTTNIVYRDLTITFGADRVSKYKGKIKVIR